MPGLIVTAAVRAMLGLHPQLTVNVLRTSWDDQTDVLHDGRADVSYVRLPADQSGLKVRSLLAEPRVAVLPSGHRLAGKDTITIADLADEHLLQDPGASAHPGLRRRRRGPPARRQPGRTRPRFFPGTGSAVRARLFRFLLAPMRRTVHAGTLFTWRRSVS